jgi:hypothetical protein
VAGDGRFACWVEPTLVAAWTRLMGDYAARAGRAIDAAAVAAATSWSDPERDVSVPRRIALRLIESGAGLHCVWTGRRLASDTLDIDHLFPWSAWPCGDLWNLLPAHREVNQRLKRDRLPSAPTLGAAGERILGWWSDAYLAPRDLVLLSRFGHEARASLPGLRTAAPEGCDPERVYAAVACSGCGCARIRACRSGRRRRYDEHRVLA